jgi:apolipoprotein N-acyltransferase
VLVDRQWTMFDRVKPSSGKTPYVRFGDAPLFAAFLLVLASMALCFIVPTIARRRTIVTRE